MYVMSRVSTVVRGAVAGAFAFIIGLLIAFIIGGVAATRLAGVGPFGGTIPEWKATIWVYFDAHFVGTRTAELFGPDGRLWSGGELVLTVSLLEIEYLFVVPVVVLVLVGALLASRLECTEGRDGMMIGMSLVFGYFPLVVIGLLVSMHFGTGPSPLRAVVIAGVVYPVFLGAIGGFLAGHFGTPSQIHDSNTNSEHEPVIR